jgi:heme exporter protein A
MIGCERLGKRYGQRWLFRNLTFRAEPGECVVILGPNGSGKSTLLKVLAGLLPGTEGTCIRPPDPRRSLGFAALDQSVYPALTLAEHFELAAQLRGCAARTAPLLEEVGLAHVPEIPARFLSTGMRARLKFALAVQADPEIVMLDEPGAGLDEQGRAMLSQLIETRRERTAFVIATNDPEERRFATHELELVK